MLYIPNVQRFFHSFYSSFLFVRIIKPPPPPAKRPNRFVHHSSTHSATTAFHFPIFRFIPSLPISHSVVHLSIPFFLPSLSSSVVFSHSYIWLDWHPKNLICRFLTLTRLYIGTRKKPWCRRLFGYGSGQRRRHPGGGIQLDGWLGPIVSQLYYLHCNGCWLL